MLNRSGFMVLSLLAAFATATAAFAQRTTGDISGTVTDTTGGVLPGVTVTAVCTDTSFTRNAVTDSTGGYRLPELPICVYKVTTELAGFKTVARDATVTTNAVAKLDFKLEVGAQSETITVEGVSPLIEYSDKLNSRVESARIEALPLSGRDFNSLLNVMPGIQHRAGGGFQGVNIGGARTSSNNFMIDGISNNEVYYGDTVLNQTAIVGIPATLVPTDAIAEFSVQQTPSAEFGVKGGAAVNIVMKSGTQHAARHRVLLPARQRTSIRRTTSTNAPRRSSGRDADPTPDHEQSVRRHVRRADSSRTRRSSSGITRASG